MSKNRKKTSKDHSKNRGKICLLCFKIGTQYNKVKFLNICPGGEIEKRINQLFAYNAISDEHLPNVVCSGCKLKLYKKKAAEPLQLSQLTRSIVTRSHRSSKLCHCKICQLVREPLFQNVDGRIIARPKNKHKNQQKTKFKVKRNSVFLDNLKRIKQLTTKEKEQITSWLLKDKMGEIMKGTKGFTTTLSQRAGRPIRIEVGSKKRSDQPQISVEDM